MNIKYYRKAGSQDQSSIDQDAERLRGQANGDNEIVGHQLPPALLYSHLTGSNLLLVLITANIGHD